MIRNKSLLTVLFALIILLGGLLALFLLANFHMAQSQTETGAAVASARWPTGAAFPNEPYHFVVDGSEPLDDALGEALASTLPNGSPAVEGGDPPRLRVTISSRDLTWTPFYGRANIEVTAAFSSNRDYSFLDSRPFFFEFSAGDDPEADKIVQAAGEITLEDQSAGLLSRPAYEQLLAEKLAVEVANMVRDHVLNAP